MTRSRIKTFGAAAAFAAAVFFFLPLPAPAQSQDKPSGKNAFEYIRALTRTDFASRDAGFEGGHNAGQWIADQFKAWGLQPAGTDGYFQDFKMPVFHADRASFTFVDGPGTRTLAYEDEWDVARLSGSADVRGEIVFAGFGVVSEKDKWDDFAGLDLKGKIVLMIPYGGPACLADQNGPEVMPDAKIKKAYELGARAVVFMPTPLDVLPSLEHYPFGAGASAGAAIYKQDLAVANINYIAAKAIFRASGIDAFTRIKKMDQDRKPCSMPLGIEGELKIEAAYMAEASLRNVLAMIPGSDRTMRGEYIVIGAHYDGLGNQPDGRLNPGADDNASGTALVMEVARAMKAAKARPKRTIVFALWDGEEQGLWGSIYYVGHPIYPLNKTLANINIDMVGNGDGKFQFRGVYYGAAIWDFLKTALPADMLKDVVPARGGPGGSDHSSFLANGVPGFFIQTTGAHYGHHNIGDKLDLIEPALLDKTCLFVQAAAEALADNKALKPEPDGREKNLLRGSTLVDLAPRDAAELDKAAGNIPYPDLDFALISLTGQTPEDLAKSFFATTAAVGASKKLLLYQTPKGFSSQRYTDRIGVLPGITDLAALAGQDALLKLMGKAGLGFVTIRDEDLALNEDEARRMTAAANETGTLVIARTVQPAAAAKVIDWSAKPGLLVAEAMPDRELLAKMKAKRWRLALIWKTGQSAEDYAARFQQATKDMGAAMVLAQSEKYGLSGFAPSFLKFAGLVAPKELDEFQIMSGGLDGLGQMFIRLLQENRPPEY